MNVRHKERVSYIRINNSLPDYALHILQNRHQYVTMADTFNYSRHVRKTEE